MHTSALGYRPQLDSLRFLAYLAVFFFHLDYQAYPYGKLGVPLFFVLSGFLITRILVLNQTGSIPSELKTFYFRRTLRIFPLYYATLVVLLLLNRLPEAPWFFLYLQNVYIFLTDGWTGNTNHFWSLCVEEQFYLLYPLILLLTPARRRTVMLLVLLIGSLCTRMVLDTRYPGSRSWALLPVAGEYLIWGSLAGLYDVRHPERPIPCRRLLLGGISFHLLAGLDQFSYHLVHPKDFAGVYQTIHGISFALIILALWRLPEGRLLRWMTLSPFVYMGKISYGLYVFHNFTYGIKDRVVRTLPLLQVIPNGVFAFGATLALAMLSWHLLEKPINQIKDRVNYRSEPVANIVE